MGLRLFSTSGFDDKKPSNMCSKWKEGEDKIKYIPSSTPQPLPNPKPDNYKILKFIQLRKYLVVKIKYLDCTNYEGIKILVYECQYKDLIKQKLIDPHFSDNKEYISPIARFEPTKNGWLDALEYIKLKSQLNDPSHKNSPRI